MLHSSWRESNCIWDDFFDFIYAFILFLFLCLFVRRGSIPDNLRKFVRGEPEEFVQKQDMLALGSR